MSKINYDDYNYRESLMNRIKVNKRLNINNNNIKNISAKDNLYYSLEKKAKIQKNKIPSLLTKNNRKKLNEIIEENNNNIVKYVNRDTFKKTINTYSNESRSKEGNIFEELQNNKYLRPMLGTTNINTKLLKCQIENPIKNIDTLSLKKYFANNIEFPFQKYQSPQKYNYNNNDEISADDKTYLYNLNNRTAIERFNINLNNGFSPTNDNLYIGENNSNSLAYSGDSYLLNNYLVKYSSNNIKKYAKNQIGRMRKEKYFYSEERKEKDDSNSNKGSAKTKIYYKNNNAIRMGSPSGNNSVKNKSKYTNIFGMGTKINLQKKIKKDKALLQYKCKLIEKFMFILNKFVIKNLDKNRSFFIKQLINYNKKSKSLTKNKIYFKKKNHRFDQKITLVKKHSEDMNKNYIFNFDKEKEKEKEKEKFKAKVTTDTSTNFNMGNKSFSNEKKNSSLSNNYILNNIKINNQSSSFLFSEQKHKNYSQSPNNSINNKHPKSQIKTKTIIYKKQLSGSPNRITGKSQSQNETRESGGAGVDTFIYKKKNLNSENRYINKLKNFDLNSLSSQSKKYNKIINNNKKGKIVGIDINLGKPVNIINDHSPLDELLLEKNNSLLYKLHTISSKFMNKNKKKNKEKSVSKKKVKPPLRTKRFLEEDDDEYIQNYYMDSNSNSNSNRAYSSIKRNSKEHNIMNKYLYNSLEEINSKINGERDFIKKNKERKDNKDNKETIIEGDKIFIRIKYVTFFNNKKKNILYNKNFKYIIIDKKKSISFSINKKIKNKKTNEIINKKGKNKKKKVSKLYVNCTKFLVKILIRLFKKKMFFIINNSRK